MKKKKIIMLVLSLFMAVSSFCVNVFAEEGKETDQPPVIETGEKRTGEGQRPEGEMPVMNEDDHNFDEERPQLPPMFDQQQEHARENEDIPDKEFDDRQEWVFDEQERPAQAPDTANAENNEKPPVINDQQNDNARPDLQQMNNNEPGKLLDQGQNMAGHEKENDQSEKSLIQRIINRINELFNLNITTEDLGLEIDQHAENGQQPDNGSTPGNMPKADGSQTNRPGNNNFPGNGSYMPGDMNQENIDHSSANTVNEDVTEGSYSSTADNENAILVQGDSVSLSDISVYKSGNSSGEDADFYGINAAILAQSGADVTIDNADITTAGTHANGVFSYGSGTTVTISDSVITTSGNNSGGLMTTGGATLNASNLTVSTSGNSSAAIRSDRGGGTVNVDEGTYSASGVGSPAIYSTADITVSNAELTSDKSEAVVIEGGNSVVLVNCEVTGNNSVLNGQSTTATNVLIYQSMSGDASEGNSKFSMTGGTLTAISGAMFHVTNVTTTIKLEDVDLTYASDSDIFLDASADSWGTSGKNGGNVTLNLIDQDIVGSITCDSASTVKVVMDASSTWTLTGDSYVTSLSGDLSGINLNGYKLYVNSVLYTA